MSVPLSEPPRRRLPAVLRWSATVVAILTVALGLVAILNLTVYLETSVPSRSTLPDLPDGLSLSGVRDGCGSGSCYLEFDVTGNGLTGDQVRDRLPAREECRANTLVDRRPRCVGYRQLDDGSVRGYVSLGKWLS